MAGRIATYARSSGRAAADRNLSELSARKPSLLTCRRARANHPSDGRESGIGLCESNQQPIGLRVLCRLRHVIDAAPQGPRQPSNPAARDYCVMALAPRAFVLQRGPRAALLVGRARTPDGHEEPQTSGPDCRARPVEFGLTDGCAPMPMPIVYAALSAML